MAASVISVKSACNILLLERDIFLNAIAAPSAAREATKGISVDFSPVNKIVYLLSVTS
jgi:hypothetical protein